jgi:23S rRNA-/tRNA-specific pseudouridylate synthase
MKPAFWSSEPDRTGATTSLREQLAHQLGLEELHIATRLDVGVSGIVLGATNPAARRHLARIVGTKACHRSYVAIVAGAAPERGCWQSSVNTRPGERAEPAITHFECVARLNLEKGTRIGTNEEGSALSLLVLRPETGRRHQLRIHSSRAGFPILGDRRYGGASRTVDPRGSVYPIERILLHAFATSLVLPSGAPWSPSCPVPEEFELAWTQFGGLPASFRMAKP